jgi:phage terminase large subunit-like protein
MNTPGSIITASDQAAVAAGYYYDQAKSDAALAWIHANLDVRLYQWQENLLRNYFGWRKADGSYRYQTLSVWIPKKNGKSFLISIIVIFKLFELRSSNIYSVSYNSKAARLVLDVAIKLFKASPTLKKHVSKGKADAPIRTYATPARREIFTSITDVKYVALADSENDGNVGNLLIVDELHLMSNSLYDITRGCLNNIPGATEIIISTAGTGDKNHRSWQRYDYAKKVLSGEIIDVSILPIIHEFTGALDTLDQIYSIDSLIAANPVLREDPARLEEARRDIQPARMARNDRAWKRFRLGVWTPTDGECYISDELYQTCLRETIDTAGRPTFVGIDKSGGAWDLIAVTLLINLADGITAEEHYTFAIEDRLEAMSNRDDIDYQQFIDRGELTVIPADAVADEWLGKWLLEKLAGKKIVGVGVDPYAAQYICETLAANGHKVSHIAQNNNTLLSPIITDYADRVKQQRIIHTANSLMDWQLTCACIYTTAKDCKKIVKQGSNTKGQGGRGHIDNIDATINALAILRSEEVRLIANRNRGTIVTA